MKTLIAAVAFATVFAAPAFAQSVHAWGWKGALAAPASAKSAYAAAAPCGLRARARCPATATSARGARRTGPTAIELRSATQRGLLIGADSMGCFVLLSMRPAFEPAATSLTAHEPSLPCIETLQPIEHVVVNWTNVTFLFI